MPHGYSNGKYYAICPHCGKQEEGIRDINNKFGYRSCDNEPQSWCKTCRSESSKASSMKRKEFSL